MQQFQKKIQKRSLKMPKNFNSNESSPDSIYKVMINVLEHFKNYAIKTIDEKCLIIISHDIAMLESTSDTLWYLLTKIYPNVKNMKILADYRLLISKFQYEVFGNRKHVGIIGKLKSSVTVKDSMHIDLISDHIKTYKKCLNEMAEKTLQLIDNHILSSESVSEKVKCETSVTRSYAENTHSLFNDYVNSNMLMEYNDSSKEDIDLKRKIRNINNRLKIIKCNLCLILRILEKIYAFLSNFEHDDCGKMYSSYAIANREFVNGQIEITISLNSNFYEKNDVIVNYYIDRYEEIMNLAINNSLKIINKYIVF